MASITIPVPTELASGAGVKIAEQSSPAHLIFESVYLNVRV